MEYHRSPYLESEMLDITALGHPIALTGAISCTAYNHPFELWCTILNREDHVHRLSLVLQMAPTSRDRRGLDGWSQALAGGR